MKPFLQTIKLFASDLAASLLFIILFTMTNNVLLSACLGISFGLIQIAVHVARRNPVDIMEWMSLFLVIASGAATTLTDDPRFVLFKPTVIYAIIGVVMLKPGWMNRYLPTIAKTVAPDIAIYLGFAWAGLMFTSAMLNAYLAVSTDLASWALTMTSFAIASKAILFVAGFAAIRLTVRRRISAMPTDRREALLISTGWQTEAPRPAKPA